MARAAASVRESDTRFSLASITVPAPAAGTMMRNELRKPHMHAGQQKLHLLQSEMQHDMTHQHTTAHLSLRNTRLMSGKGAFVQKGGAQVSSECRLHRGRGGRDTQLGNSLKGDTRTHKKPSSVAVSVPSRNVDRGLGLLRTRVDSHKSIARKELYPLLTRVHCCLAMAAVVAVRAVTPTDRAAWTDLWRAYLLFYKTVLPDEQYEGDTLDGRR